MAETSIVIESAVTPPIVLGLEDLLPSGEPAPPSLAMRIMKPKITISSPFGPTVVKPAGEPGSWQVGLLVVAIVVLLLFSFVGWIARRF
jgi:hypothetical protein